MAGGRPRPGRPGASGHLPSRFRWLDRLCYSCDAGDDSSEATTPVDRDRGHSKQQIMEKKSKPKLGTKRSAIEEFIALPDDEKDRIWQEIDRKTPDEVRAESRPLNAKEVAQWRRFKRKAGRPKVGKGAKMVALSIELKLLKCADAYAKRHGMKRSELIAKGLETVIGKAS